MRFSKQPPHRHPARLALFVVLLLCAAAAAGWLVMVLWNAVLVSALGAKPLDFWQALGLLLLCRLLFGNWGPRRMGGAHRGPSSMRDKWASMNPEQRERFREHWKSRCAKPAVETEPTNPEP